MKGPSPPSSVSSLPSPAQLALAILVLKSMPIGSNLVEHICQLRQCVQPGTRNSSKHLDSCAFWRNSYEKVEAAQSDLVDRIYERDQQIERLRSEYYRSKAPDVQSGAKRKRSLSTATKQQTTRRRTSVDRQTSGSQRNHCMIAANIDCNGSQEPVPAAFAAVLFALRQCLLTNVSISKVLVVHLRRICKVADEMLSTSITLSFPSTAKSKNAKDTARTSFRDLIRMPNTLCLCYPSLLRAIEKLPPEEGDAENGIFDIVQLYQCILGHLHGISARKVGITSRDDQHLDQDKPWMERMKIQATFSESDLHEMCVALTKLAIHCFETLDLSKLAHDKLFEGLITVFLEHLGSSLSLAVFSNANLAGLKGESTGVHPPRGLLDAYDVHPTAAIRTMEHESRYLVTILRHLMLYLDKQQSRTAPESSSLLSLTRPSNMADSTFAAKIRNRLQNTLLRGVFGDDDEAFKDALRQPAVNLSVSHIDTEIRGQEGAAEWFVGEVWKNLGWNILAGQ